MTFDEIWTVTDAIPGSFTHLNGEKYFEYALDVPDGGVIVEVGVDQGRSASVILQACRYRSIEIILVDSWESILIDNMRKVVDLVQRLGQHATVIHSKSVAAADGIVRPIDLILIDANHYDQNPMDDCKAWLPHLRSRGVALFHDYGATFPAVDAAVDYYTFGWEDLGVWDGLAIRRKP